MNEEATANGEQRHACREARHSTGSAASPGTAPAERRGDIYDPATGAGHRARRLRLRGGGRRGRGRGQRRLARPGGASPWPGGPRVLFDFRNAAARRNAKTLAALITAEHGKVLATPPARSPAAWRSSSSPAGSRTCSRAGSPRTSRRGVDSYSIRQPVGVVAGITPFNFPAMVPMWMFPHRDRLRQRRSCSSRRRRTRPRRSCWPRCWAEAGLPDGRVQRGAGRQGGGRRHPGSTRTSRRSASSAPRPSPGTCTRTGPRRASGCRPSAAPRTTWWCCPTPTSTWPRTPRCRPGSARRGSGAWRSPRWSRSTRSATSWSRRIKDRIAGLPGRPRHRRALGDGAAGHRAAPRQGRLLPGPGVRRGRHAGRGRPRSTRSSAAPPSGLLARAERARPRDAGR